MENETIAEEIDVKLNLQEKYKLHLLENGSQPASVYAFCKTYGCDEQAFYSHFGSFEALERAIFNGYIQNTILTLAKDEVFAKYSVNEKVLALLYTLIATFQKDRSFLLLYKDRLHYIPLQKNVLDDFHATFQEYVKTLIAEGLENQEVAQRPYLQEQYHRVLWVECLYILNFWINDTSAGFQQTDAAIEKSIRLVFDLIRKNALDSAIDFIKFSFQHKR